MSDDAERALIEAALARHGFTAESWDEEGEDGLTARIAGTFTVLEDDDDAGLFAGDSGTLYASVAGAAQHGNQRAMFWFVDEEYDYGDGNEVRDVSSLEHS